MSAYPGIGKAHKPYIMRIVLNPDLRMKKFDP